MVAAAVLSFLILGTDPENKATGGDPAAQRALNAVTSQVFDPRHPADSFPENYFQVMGYLPVTAVGPYGKPVLIKPDGDCSGPIGTTEFDFDIVCKQHDLSYDVLRYAADIGDPLPAAARKAADGMFGRQLHARCDSIQLSGVQSGFCHTIAESYGIICKINGWRQGYGAPAHESNDRWVAMEMMIFAFLVAGVHASVLEKWRRKGLVHDYLFLHGWHTPGANRAPTGLSTVGSDR